ncbi:MAG: hydroxyethylthiazole kinase [Geminicoccaceae bacterium]|nr:hydroxyethylthiazole kinase [Geminicoccaceae bacterium]
MASPLVEEVVARTQRDLAIIREERPRVHVLTNFVAMNVSANVMLAVGAVPSMTIDDTVIEDFVGSTRALVVNLGQLDPWRKISVPIAIAAARKLQRPWILDPVKVDRSGRRLAFAHMLIDAGPSVIRCNRDEVGMLEGESDTVLAVTGEIDHVTDGERRVDIANGSPLMDRVTAMGCAASALIGVFLAIDEDPFMATAAALLAFGIAGDVAAEKAQGPGTFQPLLIDALHALDDASIAERARVS